MAKLLFTILFLVYEVNSQKCGPSIFPGPLPYERFNVPCDVPNCPQPCQSPVPCQTCPAQPGLNINLQPSYNIGPIVPPCQQKQCQQKAITIPIQPPCGPITPPCGPIKPPCGPIKPPCGPIQPPFIPNPPTPCNTPTVGTIIDNTLANSLANAIQLLIVSNLIENTANCVTNIPNNFNCETPNCLTNIIDLTSPDYYSDPYDSILEIPCIQEQTYIQKSCGELPAYPISVQIPVSDCSCGNFVNCNGNCGNCNGIFGNIGDFICSCANGNGNCGNCNNNFANLINENGIFSNIVNGNCNCGSGNGNCCNCNSNLVNLISENGIFGNIVNGNCNCLSGNCNCGIPISCDGAIGTLAPVAAEFPIPESIPAQLVCNFGYMPTTVPCVSVNVEPLPFNNGLFC